jgi:hypothetical protein
MIGRLQAWLFDPGYPKGYVGRHRAFGHAGLARRTATRKLPAQRISSAQRNLGDRVSARRP